MLFLHETHAVVGYEEDAFEAAFREGWMPSLGENDDARLLWYTNQAHGSGASYRVVTITAGRDGQAWERLARRVQHGDLQEWARDVDRLRHEAVGKVLLPLPWGPLQDLDLASVPVGGVEHEPTVYMEDTMWPFEGRYDDYIAQAGTFYARTLGETRAADDPRFLEIHGAFQPAFGSHQRREVVLLQRVLDPDRLLGLLTTDIPPAMRAAGTWMHEALELRDRWESRLLRTSVWSPFS